MNKITKTLQANEEEFDKMTDWRNPVKRNTLFITEGDDSIMQYPESIYEIDNKKTKQFLKQSQTNLLKSIIEEIDGMKECKYCKEEKLTNKKVMCTKNHNKYEEHIKNKALERIKQLLQNSISNQS